MTIKGINVKVTVEFGLGELEITTDDIKALSEADVASEKMRMIRQSAGNVVDDMGPKNKEDLGKIIIDTVAKELGAAVKSQFQDEDVENTDTTFAEEVEKQVENTDNDTEGEKEYGVFNISALKSAETDEEEEAMIAEQIKASRRSNVRD